MPKNRHLRSLLGVLAAPVLALVGGCGGGSGGGSAPAPAAPEIERISLTHLDQQLSSTSTEGVISGNGRYVAFLSSSTELSGLATPRTHVYRKDLETGNINRVDVTSTRDVANAGVGSDVRLAISTDGHSIAFTSQASNLAAGDSAGHGDVFLKNMTTGALVRVSMFGANEPNAECLLESMSADGRYIVFSTPATNHGTTGGTGRQIFRWDRISGSRIQASLTTSGTAPNDGCWGASVSDDGNRIAFVSNASNLTGSADPDYQVYLRTLSPASTIRLSRGPLGAAANSACTDPVISGTGRFVAFTSRATNLVPEAGPVQSVYVVDLEGLTTSRASVRSGGEADLESAYGSSFSSDGRQIAFLAIGPDDDDEFNVYVRDRTAGTTRRVTRSWTNGVLSDSCTQVNLSASGAEVVFSAYAENLVADDTNGYSDVFFVVLPPSAGG